MSNAPTNNDDMAYREGPLGPDWTPGPDGIPEREAGRVVIFDSTGKTLIVRGHDYDSPGRQWLFTVGGGLEPGESSRTAAVREAREETGINLVETDLEGPILTRVDTFEFIRVTSRQYETFYRAQLGTSWHQIATTTVSQTVLESNVIDGLIWLSADDLDDMYDDGATMYPTGLNTLVRGWSHGWDGTTPHLGEPWPRTG